jgi:1-acyl-sn-glycerol-3-phosphate acyltransferase
MSSVLSNAWYDLTYLATMTGLSWAFSLRTEGWRNVPATGPALLLANHQSFLDPPTIGVAARRRVNFLARKTLFNNPVFGRLISSLRATPIDQEGFARDGLKTILEQLKKGEAVLVFPEGERTPHGEMLPLKPGITLLLKRVETPIVPIGIAGAYDAFPRWRPYPVPSPLFWPANKGAVAVSIGKPLDSKVYAGMEREQALAALFTELQKQQQQAEKLRRKR